MIIEQTDTYPGGQTVMTVRTERGDEYVIDVDAAVEAVARLLSDYDNNRKRGWALQAPWFEHAIKNLRTSAIPSNK